MNTNTVVLLSGTSNIPSNLPNMENLETQIKQPLRSIVRASRGIWGQPLRVSLSGVYSFLIKEAKAKGSLSVLKLSYGSDLQERTEGALAISIPGQFRILPFPDRVPSTITIVPM